MGLAPAAHVLFTRYFFTSNAPGNPPLTLSVPQILQCQPQEFKVVQPRSFCAFEWVSFAILSNNHELMGSLGLS